MAQRLWTANDQPTKPTAWVDAQVSGSITRDASNVISAVAMQGAAGGTLTPPSTAMAPVYAATGFDGSSLPGIQFSPDVVKRLTGGTSIADAQPFTLVLVFRSGSSRAGYGIVFDTAANGNGDRAIFFDRRVDQSDGNFVAYANNLAPIPNTTAASAQFIVVQEFNGANSRAWVNGVLTTGMNPGSFGALVGLALGGSDSGTSFRGVIAEAILFPDLFSGDAFDRLCQGTAWKWKMQSIIPTGATYKTAAPVVDDGASAGISAAAASALGSLGVAAAGALLIAGATSGALGPVSAAGAGAALIKANAGSALRPVASQASGQLRVIGATASQLDSMTVAAAGTVPIRGAASTGLDPIATSAAATLVVHGSASAMLDSVTVDARAGGTQSTSGVTAATLGPITAAAAGSGRISAVAGAMLAPFQATGAGSAKIVSGMAGQLGSVAVSAAATALLRSATAATLGPIGVTSDARLPIRATASVTLDQIGFAASALSDGVPVVTPPDRIVHAPAQLRLVRAIARPRIVFARG